MVTCGLGMVWVGGSAASGRGLSFLLFLLLILVLVVVSLVHNFFDMLFLEQEVLDTRLELTELCFPSLLLHGQGGGDGGGGGKGGVDLLATAALFGCRVRCWLLWWRRFENGRR